MGLIYFKQTTALGIVQEYDFIVQPVKGTE